MSVQLCIQNNPEEARQMLLQNPQLSYALLQAQVVMKIVNPEIAQVWFAEISIVNLRARNCYICKQNSAQKIHCFHQKVIVL